MIITYQGDSYFRLQAGNLTVLVDPTNQRSFKGANLIINTFKPALIVSPGESEPVWIDHQGEFEIKGIQVRGWSAGYEKNKERTVYRLTMDDLTVVILGQVVKLPSENFEDYLAGADIVLGPAANSSVGSRLKNLKPALVIPALKGKELESFLKEFGQKECETMEKLVIKKKDISSSKTKVVCFKS